MSPSRLSLGARPDPDRKNPRIDRDGLQRWIAAYVRLWRTPGTDGLSEIFSENATYRPGPFSDTRSGLDAISELWESERLGPDEDFDLTSEAVAIDGDTAVARVEVRYGPPRNLLYRDVWIVTFGSDGRCTAFEEWPFWPPGSKGSVAGSG
jgi:hypothetical protein